MHVAITEEIFATERLAPSRKAPHPNSGPDSAAAARPTTTFPRPKRFAATLGETRAQLIETLADYGDDRLEEIIAAFAPRKIRFRPCCI